MLADNVPRETLLAETSFAIKKKTQRRKVNKGGERERETWLDLRKAFPIATTAKHQVHFRASLIRVTNIYGGNAKRYSDSCKLMLSVLCKLIFL